MSDYKPVVLVDADEVIFDLVSEWLDVYKRFGGESVRREDITNYVMMDQVKQPELLFKAIDKGPALRNVRPLPGAIEGLKLLNDTCDTYIVTYARHESWGRAHEAKLASLWEHAPWFDRDKVIFARHKHLISGDYLIEDNPDTLGKWEYAQSRYPGGALLIDQPWNQSIKGFSRFESLLTAAQFIIKENF